MPPCYLKEFLHSSKLCNDASGKIENNILFILLLNLLNIYHFISYLLGNGFKIDKNLTVHIKKCAIPFKKDAGIYQSR